VMVAILASAGFLVVVGMIVTQRALGRSGLRNL